MFLTLCLIATAHAGVTLIVAGDAASCPQGSAQKKFEGAEHLCLAQFGELPLLRVNSSNATQAISYGSESLADFRFVSPSNVTLGSYGDVVAMAGDFFSVDLESTVICTGATPQERRRRFELALATLDAAPARAIDLIRGEFDEELAALNRNETEVPYEVYKEFSFARFLLEIAAKVFPSFATAVYRRLIYNYDHFGDFNCSTIAYETGHLAAMETAREAGDRLRQVFANTTAADVGLRRDALQVADTAWRRAYLMDAFVTHFMTDSFASGHLRTPRRELVDMCDDSAGGLLANYMHDEENRGGLPVVNARGDRWTAYGDQNMFDPRNARNLELAREAVDVSRREVAQAFQQGTIASPPAALQLLPRVDAADPRAPCPLFRLTPTGSLEQRDDAIRQPGWDQTPLRHPHLVPSSAERCVETTTDPVLCSYRALNLSHCPGTVELAFAKQPFVDPGLFGARTLCFSERQNTWIMRYGNSELSTAQIAGIAIAGIVVLFFIALCIACCCVCCHKRRALKKNKQGEGTEMQSSNKE